MTDARDYSATLFLPQTDFPMRAGLPAKEPEILARWERLNVYQRLREAARGRTKFILHDGPPYANGNIHIGTALNKILKDVVTRSQQMLGYDSNYVPGWDCHGLPIEWKIEEENYRSKGKAKPDLSDPSAMIAFRKECRAFAEHWLEVQRTEFRRLGVEGDWGHPYTTMSFPAEAQIARELMKFAANGTLYRGSKPVMWSVVEKTALAEAEVEYEDYVSDQVWVKFPVAFAFGKQRRFDALEKKYRGTSIVIWTTTPWTIPGNRAISYSPKVKYVLVEVSGPDRDERQLPVKPDHLTAAEREIANGNGISLAAYADGLTKELSYKRKNVFLGKKERLIVAEKLVDDLAKVARASSVKVIRNVPLKDLVQLGCAHPLNPALKSRKSWSLYCKKSRWSGKSKYAFVVPLLSGDHVSDDAGTGFVHTAPGHGREDFEVWTSNARQLQLRGIKTPIPYTVDENGAFTRHAPGFVSKRVINDEGERGEANEAVIKALVGTKALIVRDRLKHQYPHSWRSKKPVIFRNTPQWFIAMDKPFSLPAATDKPDTLRHRALTAITQTRWVPPQGENRITGMIESRPDWVISRQRAWGVPIAVFVRETGDGSAEILQDEAVNKRIGEAFEAEGADAWYAEGARERFLGSLADEDWKKVDDILDVWFDSGSTHAFTLEDPRHFPSLAGIRRKKDGGLDTVMYLEGSDQHRGWFHSSLLESCGTRGVAPFDVVLTHGFVLDEHGRKMSKSLGNTVAPQDVMKQSGADILRMWASASDYADDLRIGPEILKTTVDTYRKLRNTIRWMLGNLVHFRPEDRIAVEKMPELERLMLHRLAELDALVRQAYVDFDYKRIFAALNQFMTVDLSAFYFDVRKDALYCDPYSSGMRKAALTVIDQLFGCTVTWLAPMLCFTAEEAWVSRYPGEDSSVHLELFPELPAAFRDDALAEKWRKIRLVRRVVTGALEVERAAKRIGSSLEAAPIVYVSDIDLFAALVDVDLAEVSITSAATLVEGEGPADAFRLPDVAGVAVVPQRAEGRKCARSWKILSSVGSDPDYPDVTPRDAQALREWDAIAKAAE